eukprot:1917926-Prorocentrum_lima.AAC.1
MPARRRPGRAAPAKHRRRARGLRGQSVTPSPQPSARIDKSTECLPQLQTGSCSPASEGPP